MELPEDVLPSLALEEFKKYGDAWKDNFYSLKNLLMQLHSLKKVTELVEKFKPDCVLFIRPDMVYHDPIETIYYHLCQRLKKSVSLPEWQWGIGVNDRFDLVEKGAYQSYGKRLDEAMNFCKEGNQALHSEKLLKYALLKNDNKIYILNAKASRVRINGEYAPEKFVTNIKFFSPLTNKHKRFLFFTQLRTKIELYRMK